MPVTYVRNGGVMVPIATVPSNMATLDTTQTITGSKTFSVPLTAPAYAASGLTGAVSPSRYVGSTPSVAPTSGTFVLGDWVVTQTARMFVCTTGGTPGTWTEVGSAAVTSVASRTGAVVLTAADIAAGTFPAGNFIMPGALQTSGSIVSSDSTTTPPTYALVDTKAGQATPQKSFRSNGGNLEFLAHGGAVIATLTDPGAFTAADLQVGGASISRGRRASAQITANFTVGTSEAIVTGLTSTFTFVTGRRYRISVHAILQQPASLPTAGAGELRVRWAAGASVTTAGAQLQANPMTFAATASQKFTFDFFVEITCVASGATGNQINAGSNTVGVGALMPTASSVLIAGATFPAQILIEDIGV